MDTAVCIPEDLTRELAMAAQGETVQIGTCEITGSFSIPAGVKLKGQGSASTIHGLPGKPALSLVPGPGATQPTRVSDLTIKSDGTAGILAMGSGSIEIEAVTVIPTVGIGIGVEGVTSLVVKTVTLTGPVDAKNTTSVPYPPAPGETATHGIVLVDVKGSSNALTGVTATQFADYGALFVGSEVSWTGGGALNNLGTGLMIVGGTVDLNTVDLIGNFKGNRPLPAYGAVITDHVTSGIPPTLTKVTSTKLTVKDNIGIGVLHDGAMVDAHHTDLVGQNNGRAAVWAQGGKQKFRLDNPQVDKTIFSGLVAVDMQNIIIMGGFFRDAKAMMLPGGPGMTDVTLGDGIHIVRSTNVDVQNVSLTGNERAGVLVDLGTLDAVTANLKWANVNVSAPANGFGALCQRHQNGQFIMLLNEAPSGWDAGILRDAATSTIDGSKPSPMEIGGAVGPEIIPAPITVIKGGLTGIIGP